MSIKGKRQKQPKSPTTDEWISKMQSSYKMKYYSERKSDEILIYATIQASLKDMLTERVTKDVILSTQIHEITRKGKSVEKGN